MDAFILVYNIICLLFYSVPIIFAFIFYMDSKKPVYLYVIGLFLCYAIDHLIICLTELVDWFSKMYDSTFMAVPTLKTILFAGIFFCMVMLNRLLLHPKENKRIMVLLGLLIVYLLFVPMMKNGPVKVWCYYTPCQVFSFIVSVFGLHMIKKRPDAYSDVIKKKYKHLLLWTAIFSILIIIEDTVVIFNYDVYSPALIEIKNRNICADILYFYHAIAAVAILAPMLNRRLQSGTVADAEIVNTGAASDVTTIESSDVTVDGITTVTAAMTATAVSVENDQRTKSLDMMTMDSGISSDASITAGGNQASAVGETASGGHPVTGSEEKNEGYARFYLFCHHYQLTAREQEILQLLLENMSNVTISETLSISEGTAKAHIHNIFAKVEVRKRQQLIQKYNLFHE